jgi:threonylcarbamoyladenosine tRNA methylthiotransferase MtaB
MSAPRIVTFGCRLNAYETEIMRAHAADAGVTDTVIFNSCAVTAEAERQARQAIRRARRENPSARIVVTGCAAQINPEVFAAMPEVDMVMGNEEKLDPESFRRLAADDCEGTGNEDKIRVNDIMSVRETAPHMITGFEGRARAFVQVQQGCDHRCTFCIIPFGRGPSRSVPLGALVRQVRTLTTSGFCEVVLTGVDITDYGTDLPGRPTLGAMVRRLLVQVPELERLRLSSLDPAEVDGDLFALIESEPRLLPYFHLGLQSGDDIILKRMKRRHSRIDAIEFCARVRALRPDAVFGADLIAGFPTETEAMFGCTMDLIEACGLTYLHVFPYSERPGTAAAKMPPVPVTLRRERAARLREAGAARLRDFLDARVGTSARVLVEDTRSGRSEHYAPVTLDRDAVAGAVVSARILRRAGDRLEARPAA